MADTATPAYIPLEGYQEYPAAEMLERAEAFYAEMRRRRTVRMFSDRLVHHADLATLTHTPSPMGFLSEILGRPVNERPFLLLVTGYPAESVTVPLITKKPLTEIATFV